MNERKFYICIFEFSLILFSYCSYKSAYQNKMVNRTMKNFFEEIQTNIIKS